MEVHVGQLRGRAPAKQARSRQTRERLIAAGRKLLETRAFEDIAISELASTAGCSVGAFYHHFSDKEDYYDAVVAAQLEHLWQSFEARFRAEELNDLPTREVLARTVDFIRTIMCDNQSLIRISFRRSFADEEAWTPIRAFGRAFEARVVELLAEREIDFTVPDWRAALAFGMQMLYGTLLNAILRRPGPLYIEDEALSEALSAMLAQQLRMR